jgi:hypothetical protein
MEEPLTEDAPIYQGDVIRVGAIFFRNKARGWRPAANERRICLPACAPFMAAFTMENQARMRVTITSDRIETSGNNRPVATAGRQLRRCARIPAPA